MRLAISVPKVFTMLVTPLAPNPASVSFSANILGVCSVKFLAKFILSFTVRAAIASPSFVPKVNNLFLGS